MRRTRSPPANGRTALPTHTAWAARSPMGIGTSRQQKHRHVRVRRLTGPDGAYLRYDRMAQQREARVLLVHVDALVEKIAKAWHLPLLDRDMSRGHRLPTTPRPQVRPISRASPPGSQTSAADLARNFHRISGSPFQDSETSQCNTQSPRRSPFTFSGTVTHPAGSARRP